MYPRIGSICPRWSNIWKSIPKFIWQKIWLARNDIIFNNKFSKPEIVIAKEKSMLMEALGNQIEIDPSTVEYQWIGSSQQEKPQKNFGKPFIKSKWQMRLPKTKFLEWWKRKNKASVFFDGAYKGNLGIVEVGGMLYYPRGMSKSSFSRGIG